MGVDGKVRKITAAWMRKALWWIPYTNQRSLIVTNLTSNLENRNRTFYCSLKLVLPTHCSILENELIIYTKAKPGIIFHYCLSLNSHSQCIVKSICFCLQNVPSTHPHLMSSEPSIQVSPHSSFNSVTATTFSLPPHAPACANIGIFLHAPARLFSRFREAHSSV